MLLKSILIRKPQWVLCLLGCVSIFGQAMADESSAYWEDMSKEAKKTCSNVSNIFPPKLPNAIAKKSLKNCNSMALYYGFENSPDYIKAKECALIKKNYYILAMIYANGKGVPRDLDKALHYICMLDVPADEIESRIHHLYKMKEAKDAKKNFDICDDVASGYMMVLCADMQRSATYAQQMKYLNSLQRNWSINEKKLFQQLQNASRFYFEARTDNEINRIAIHASENEISEDVALNKRMMELIKKTEQCQLPLYTLEQYQAADKQINSLYQQVLKGDFSNCLGIKLDGIKETERAWVKYKDAWVNFGQTKCPSIPVDSWKTIITKERIEELDVLVRMGQN